MARRGQGDDLGDRVTEQLFPVYPVAPRALSREAGFSASFRCADFFLPLRAVPSTTATGTAARSPNTSLLPLDAGLGGGTTACSCEWSIGLPICLRSRSYSN